MGVPSNHDHVPALITNRMESKDAVTTSVAELTSILTDLKHFLPPIPPLLRIIAEYTLGQRIALPSQLSGIRINDSDVHAYAAFALDNSLYVFGSRDPVIYVTPLPLKPNPIFTEHHLHIEVALWTGLHMILRDLYQPTGVIAVIRNGLYHSIFIEINLKTPQLCRFLPFSTSHIDAVITTDCKGNIYYEEGERFMCYSRTDGRHTDISRTILPKVLDTYFQRITNPFTMSNFFLSLQFVENPDGQTAIHSEEMRRLGHIDGEVDSLTFLSSNRMLVSHWVAKTWGVCHQLLMVDLFDLSSQDTMHLFNSDEIIPVRSISAHESSHSAFFVRNGLLHLLTIKGWM
jgi:hypothetical protein